MASGRRRYNTRVIEGDLFHQSNSGSRCPPESNIVRVQRLASKVNQAKVSILSVRKKPEASPKNLVQL